MEFLPAKNLALKFLFTYEFTCKVVFVTSFLGMKESIGEYKMVFIFLEAQLCISSIMTWNH